MEFFSKIGSFLHNLVDRGFRYGRDMVSDAWRTFIRPGVERVATWIGVNPETVRAVCVGVESAASRVADVLLANVKEMVTSGCAWAAAVVTEWLAHHVTGWSAIVLEGIRRIVGRSGQHTAAGRARTTITLRVRD
jgi:hypothetical protein